MRIEQSGHSEFVANKEQKELATSIFQRLQKSEKQGVSISTPGWGVVPFRTRGEEVEVFYWYPATRERIDELRNQNFGADFTKGLANIDRESKTQTTHKRVGLTLDSKFKITQRDRDEFFDAVLSTSEVFALEAVADLSILPAHIARDFGTFENFSAALDKKDVAFKTVYQDGLDALVDDPCKTDLLTETVYANFRMAFEKNRPQPGGLQK